MADNVAADQLRLCPEQAVGMTTANNLPALPVFNERSRILRRMPSDTVMSDADWERFQRLDPARRGTWMEFHRDRRTRLVRTYIIAASIAASVQSDRPWANDARRHWRRDIARKTGRINFHWLLGEARAQLADLKAVAAPEPYDWVDEF